MRCWDKWTGICKRNETGPPIIPYPTINSKWIKDLNITCDTIKVPQEDIGSKISDTR